MKLTELRCANCGANLSFTNVVNNKIKCEYCESSFEIDDPNPSPVKEKFRASDSIYNTKSSYNSNNDYYSTGSRNKNNDYYSNTSRYTNDTYGSKKDTKSDERIEVKINNNPYNRTNKNTVRFTGHKLVAVLAVASAFLPILIAILTIGTMISESTSDMFGNSNPYGSDNFFNWDYPISTATPTPFIYQGDNAYKTLNDRFYEICAEGYKLINTELLKTSTLGAEYKSEVDVIAQLYLDRLAKEYPEIEAFYDYGYLTNTEKKELDAIYTACKSSIYDAQYGYVKCKDYSEMYSAMLRSYEKCISMLAELEIKSFPENEILANMYKTQVKEKQTACESMFTEEYNELLKANLSDEMSNEQLAIFDGEYWNLYYGIGDYADQLCKGK